MRRALAAGAALAALAMAQGTAAQEPASATLEDARVKYDGRVLVLANSRIERRFDWNGGALITTWLGFDGESGWTMRSETPDLVPFGTSHTAHSASLTLREVAADAITPAHLEVSVETRGPTLDLRRTCRVFPRVPAIPCTVAYRGQPREADDAAPATRDVIENAALSADRSGDAIERLALPPGHWPLTVAAFRAATDYNDWLVDEDEGELYRQPLALAGNVLELQDTFGRGQIFLIKEAPAKADQIAWPGHDFVTQQGNVRVEGSGIDPATLSPDAWRNAYTVTVGVAAPGRGAALLARRAYMDTRRSYRHDRDGMILMNTWGDRNRDAAMSESFALAQLEAAHRLGLTHLQLDDGWQAGLSKNSAASEGALWEEWSTEAWQPHPERFPRGLGPVVARANELGMEIGLWFNPTRTEDYALWQRDATILVDLYRRHGIRIFKIDGIEVPNRKAAENLEKMFAQVSQATGGRTVFNFDVTAGRRPGYLDPVNRFGNLFVENRYTDWGNYYPHRTLRNLWMLSAHVPPQFLQIEFLNIWRNPDRYPPRDPLAPARVGFEYAFAATMMAQPLAWFEATGLPDEAFATAPLLKVYGDHAASIHEGQILPIGERPDGTRWTGFQSLGRDGESGYLLVLREFNQSGSVHLATLLPPGRRVRLDHLAGQGRSRMVRVGSDGRIPVALPQPHNFALYRYHILDR